MNLSKSYQNVIVYESVKLMKNNLYEHSNNSIEDNAYLIQMMIWEII